MGLSDRRTSTSGTSTSTNSYGFQPIPETQDIATARNTQPRIDPSIGYRLGEQQRRLDESLASPTGGYVTPQIRDAIRRSGQREMMQMAGQQTREGAFDVNRLNMQKNLALANLTRPILTQTGSTTTGQSTGTQGQSPWATALGIGTGIAPISL